MEFSLPLARRTLMAPCFARSMGRLAIAAGGSLAAAMSISPASVADELSDKVWIHGAENCEVSRDPPLEVFGFDADTYILRQSKCVHFEAPFIYVLFGKHTVFIQDTGATEDPAKFPLYNTIQQIIHRRGTRGVKMLVTHSHSHGDHKAADAQFRGKPGVTLVEPTSEGVREYFKFKDWPKGEAVIDLGGRKLIVQPAPGHQDEALIVYDSRT